VVNPCFVPINQMTTNTSLSHVYEPSSFWDEATRQCRSCALRFWETQQADTLSIWKLSGIIYSTLTVETCYSFTILWNKRKNVHKVLSNSQATQARKPALIFISASLSHTLVMLWDQTSASHSVPVYAPAFANTKFYYLVTEAHRCEQLLHSHYAATPWLEFKSDT